MTEESLFMYGFLLGALFVLLIGALRELLK